MHLKEFHKLEHPTVQHHFSWCHHSPDNQPFCKASHQNIKTFDKSKKWSKERTIINKWSQELTQTDVAGMSATYDMAKSKQISRVTSANTTHLT
jgi:CDGSH-type Zn-finger protein